MPSERRVLASSVARLALLASLAAACGGASASGSGANRGGDPGGGDPAGAPTIRTGFPVVANQGPTAPPYTLTTAPFSAAGGDTLVAVASAFTFPIVQGTTLRWVQRALTRSNTQRDHQTALYTAVVPPGGVTAERAWFAVPTTQEWSVNSSPSSARTPTTPAQLQVFAFDGASGVGSVRWRGNQGATAATAGLTMKANATASLLLVGGADWDLPSWGAGAGATLVGQVTNGMGVLTRVAGAPGSVAVTSTATSTSWEMAGIEILPAGVAPPTRKLLTLGDSGTESNDSNNPWPPLVQEALGPDWALYGGGVWWADSDQVRARWSGMWSREGFDVVTLHVGTNDVIYRGGLLATDWAALADSIAGSGSRLLVQTIESTSWYGTPGQAAVDAADATQRANVPAGSTLFDWDAALGTTSSQVVTYLSPDGIHWNDAGNSRVAAVAASQISAMGVPPRPARATAR